MSSNLELKYNKSCIEAGCDEVLTLHKSNLK